MDALKKGLDKVKGGDDKPAEDASAGASAGGAAPQGQQQQGGDYVDKGEFPFVAFHFSLPISTFRTRVQPCPVTQ